MAFFVDINKKNIYNFKMIVNSNKYSTQNLSTILGISTATFLNWKKEGLIPEKPKKDDEESFKKYIYAIKKNTSNKLNTRANRLYSSDKFIVYQGIKSKERKDLLLKLISTFESSIYSVEEGVLSLIICQLVTSNLLHPKWTENPQTRIEKSICNWISQCNTKHNTEDIISLFKSFFIKNENDDIIGAFYQSVLSIGEKSSNGSFYTPTNLLTEINAKKNTTIYDPCCGSGNILLNVISKDCDSSLIYASDIDELALKICETNLVLFFNNPNIKSHIFKNNFFQKTQEEKQTFDLIVTNPPWGAKFSITEKTNLLKDYFFLENTESFSICLYNAINLLSPNGNLYFFLPKSILNVASHKKIRKIILDLKAKISIEVLGNAFKGVVSEGILLNIDKNNYSDFIEIKEKNKIFELNKIECKSPNFYIYTKIKPTDVQILNKIFSVPHTTLKNNANFALGIVTGNNKLFITNKKNSTNEPIYKGKHITPFYLKESSEFIEFTPNKFQQVAKTEFYRSRKIVYRFICNKIVCCISENNELMLNSANIFIPTIDYPLETIVCLFNSFIYEYIYKKKFDSVKILRSQIEEMPLPNLTLEDHKIFYKLYQKINKNEDFKSIIYDIDNFICKIFNISNEEQLYIKGEIK